MAVALKICKMKILYLIPSWGAPSELWILRMLDMIKHHNVLICTRDVTSVNNWQSIPIVNLQAPPSLFSRVIKRINKNFSYNTQSEKLEKEIKKHGIDCIFIHFLNFAIQYEKVLKNLDIPILVHCHGADVNLDIRLHTNAGTKVYGDDYKKQILDCENFHFIANSKFTLSNLKKIGLSENRISLKYLGVPVAETLSMKKRIPTEPFQILFLGRLIDCKGPDLVIKAFELAQSRGLNGKLIIAGDGPLRVTCELLKARSRYSESIELLGAVDAEEGEKLRTSAHIFTAHNIIGPLSKQEEAFGVSIIEAMAAGLPVVSARSGALTETVIHGQTGILLEPEDITGHADAFLRLAENENLRAEMGTAGWKRAKDFFSVNNEKKTLLSILDRTKSLHKNKRK